MFVVLSSKIRFNVTNNKRAKIMGKKPTKDGKGRSNKEKFQQKANERREQKIVALVKDGQVAKLPAHKVRQIRQQHKMG